MKRLLLALLVLSGFQIIVAQQRETIYDESKVPSYFLPVTLSTDDAVAVNTPAQWEKQRRPQLLSMFATEMFGKTPKEQLNVRFEEVAANPEALDGKATSKQIKITFSNGSAQREMLMLIYLPNQVKGKVPIFLAYNYMGNHTIINDEDIIPSATGTPGAKRGGRVSRWPIELILSAGYGVATACYNDLFQDGKGLHSQSILPLFTDNEVKNTPDSWQAIGAWAWGFSRAMDYFETDSRIDHTRVALMGHSRQGKAALWAGAQDERFAMVISNNSGCGGAALSKRTFGETIEVINTAFPHWFCDNYKAYNGKEKSMTFDQQQLLALIAPRPLYVASAEEDRWADPRGEYLSAYYVGEVYEKIYGYKGLPSIGMPSINSPVMERVGYHIRTGVHDVTTYDWEQFIIFADKWMK